MASAKLFGCAINVEPEEEGGGGSSIAVEIPRSGVQPEGEAISLSVCFPPPLNQRGINPYFSFLESNSDTGSAPMDSESDLHNCFIDFFDREAYEVETVSEFNFWGFRDTEEKIELGLGIGTGSGSGSGSGSGEIRGDSGGLGLQVNRNRETDSGRVEAGTGLTPVGDDLFGEEAGMDVTPGWDDLFDDATMVAGEELEWEDLQNAVTWVQEPVQVSIFSLEEAEEDGEELSVALRDDDQDEHELHWQVLLPVNNGGLFEEFEDTMADSGVMDLDYGVFLASIDEYGEDHGDYDAVLAQTFDHEAGTMGSPPASKRVVDDLPVVEITTEELSKGEIVCAICKDEVVVKEKVKKLPCRHYYHGECIIPWLGIRNTCPVCRYELPTDDLEYERNRRSQRDGSSGLDTDFDWLGT